MTGTGNRLAELTTTTTAPAGRAYGLVADVTRWPLLFAPCLHVDLLDGGPDGDRFRMWVLSGGTVRSWTSVRQADDAALRVTFRQERPAPPLSAAAGTWQFEGSGTERPNRIALTNAYELTDPADTRTAAFLAQALERHNTEEVAAVRYWAERPEDLGDLLFSFTDEVEIDGPAEAVHEFLYRADLWPERLAHVTRLELETSPAAGADVEQQTLEMDTLSPDGSVHTSRSVRLCFAGERIVFHQTSVPRPLRAHGGVWSVDADGSRTRVSVRHDVALDPEAIESVLGAGTTPSRARATVQDLLRRNSLRTLERAGAYAAERAAA